MIHHQPSHQVNSTKWLKVLLSIFHSCHPVHTLIILFITHGLAHHAYAQAAATNPPPSITSADTPQDSAKLSVQIKKRLYKTKRTVEFTAQVGGLLNHPYLGATRISNVPTPSAYHSSLSYHFSPRLGLSVDGTWFSTTSNGTRRCVEYFYNTWSDSSVGTCVSTKDDSPESADAAYSMAKNNLARYKNKGAQAPNMGPAYPAILDPLLVVGGSVVWIPVYGKLLVFMKWVKHFSAFMKFGGGVTISDFYPLKLYDSTGHRLRGVTPAKSSKQRYPGVTADQVNEYGKKGRPPPQRLYIPTANIGVGQNFNLHAEGRALVLSGYDGNRTDLFYTMWGGLGFRI